MVIVRFKWERTDRLVPRSDPHVLYVTMSLASMDLGVCEAPCGLTDIQEFHGRLGIASCGGLIHHFRKSPITGAGLR